MTGAIESAAEEARAHHRNAGAAIAFVGALGLGQAALFSRTGDFFFIDPKTMAMMSVAFLGIGAWMSFTRPSGLTTRPAVSARTTSGLGGGGACVL